MKVPTIAIVGRPNVGKSTIFNALVGRRVAIVEPTSGVTRDRVSALMKSEDLTLELVDTGGMGVETDALSESVEEQIRFAIERADALVFVVDGSVGLVPQDREIAAKLRTTNKTIVFVANKVDTQKVADSLGEFSTLGMGEPMPVSAVHRRKTGDLRDQLFQIAAEVGGVHVAPDEMRIAVVGQRNVGKSTFINALAREKRVIVSELPGTTRDSVDVRFEKDGKVFVAIDTAGVRKKHQLTDAIEFFSRVRAEESIRQADVVLLLLDVQSRVTQVDKHLAEYVVEHYKPCVIVVNKWDLAKDMSTDDFLKYIEGTMSMLSFAPISFISAMKSKGIQRTIDLANSLWKQGQTRVSTPMLNRAIEALKTLPQVDARGAHRPKIYYATQVQVSPPTIVLFVNSPRYFSLSYRRSIVAFLRRQLPFKEIPICLRLKQAADRHLKQTPS